MAKKIMAKASKVVSSIVAPVDLTMKEALKFTRTAEVVSAYDLVVPVTGRVLSGKRFHELLNSKAVQSAEFPSALMKCITSLKDPGNYIAKEGYHRNKYENQQIAICFDYGCLSLATNVPTNVINRAVKQVRWSGDPSFEEFVTTVAQFKKVNNLSHARVYYIDAAGKEWQTNTLEDYFQVYMKGRIC